MADQCPGILRAIVWLLGLLFIGWPVGFFIVWVYVMLIPFTACIEPLKGACDALLKLVQLPLFFAESMIQMKPCGS
jgi:hypothetical protein